MLAAAQLARYLGEYSPDPDADAAAADPCAVTRAHVEAFQAWMIETRSASTALNKYTCLQQFFGWLRAEKSGVNPNRTYRLTYRVRDVAGNVTTAVAEVRVAPR